MFDIDPISRFRNQIYISRGIWRTHIATILNQMFAGNPISQLFVNEVRNRYRLKDAKRTTNGWRL